MNNKTTTGLDNYCVAARSAVGGITPSVRSGVVLLITLVLLVVLAIGAYSLSMRVASRRHRDKYLIDYCKASYSCSSAVKYALATLEDINNPQLIERPDEPDFSDVFLLSESEYVELLESWVSEKTSNEKSADVNEPAAIEGANSIINDINDVNETISDEGEFLIVRGPYGPRWPLITAPAEFEIGSVKVKIEIADENAKYPIGWAMMSDESQKRLGRLSFEIFCEWMDINDTDIELLTGQLGEISRLKPFKVDIKPVKKRVKENVKLNRKRRRRTVTKKIPVAEQIKSQCVDFAKFLHSSLIDTDILARTTIIDEERKESALKYISLWAGRKININTAPRQVLEATFIFGGDEVEIAESIIRQRRIKPFENIEELRKSLLRYSASIEKCEKYITASSTFFTIRVTATSGLAQASAVIAVRNNKGKMEPVAITFG